MNRIYRDMTKSKCSDQEHKGYPIRKHCVILALGEATKGHAGKNRYNWFIQYTTSLVNKGKMPVADNQYTIL